MQPFKYETQLDDTMTQDGVPISFHAIMVLKVTDSVNLIRNFRTDWYKNNLEEPFKTMVRQAVRKRGMRRRPSAQWLWMQSTRREIRDGLTAFMASKGLPVTLD